MQDRSSRNHAAGFDACRSPQPAASYAAARQVPFAQPAVPLREYLHGTALAPGMAMILLGTIGLICPAFFTLHLTVPELVGAEPLHPPNAYEVLAAVLILGGMFLLNLLIILGGVSLIRMRRRKLALTGAGLCLVQLIPFWPASLGVGIWALVVLLREDVKEAFNEALPTAAELGES